MYIIKQIQKTYLDFIFNSIEQLGSSGAGDDRGNSNKAEKLKNIDISLEDKKQEILQFLSSGEIISLLDDEDLKEDIEEKLRKNMLGENQINTIYEELKKIKNIEDSILTPKTLEKIKDKTNEEKFEELNNKIKKIKEQANIDHAKEIEEAEEMMCKILGLCDGIKQIKEESKEKRKELSKEKLQTITNHEFLKISPENRLQYITKNHIDSENISNGNIKNHIDSENISNGNIKNIEFTFSFNGKFNRELWLKTTAGQVLPSEVGEVKSNGITYKRDGLKGEFFDTGNIRLIINEGTKIEVSKLRTPEDIKKLQENTDKRVSEFIEKNKEYKAYEDIVSEAIARNIDPKFAIIAFKDKVDKINNIFERGVLIEEMFTEYDRKKGKLSLNKNAGDGLKVLVLREFTGEDWKQKAKELGIKDEVIKNYESREYSVTEFLNKAKEISELIEEKYGIPRQVVLGMSLLESANGQSKLTKLANNAFGYKARAGQTSVAMMTGEYRNGSYQKELANFRAFNTLEESFKVYAQLLTRASRYRNAFNYKNNPEKFLYEIIKAGYATLAPEKYVSNVKARLRHFGESLA